MRALAILAAVACCAAIALVAFALRLRSRTRRVLAETPAADPSAGRLVDQPRALWHGAAFADGLPLRIPDLRDACVADLFCTAEAIFVQREGPGALLVIPIASISDASLHRAWAPLAQKDLPMLRLRFRRGGELIEANLSLRGGMASLEQLRREIHLRQGAADALRHLIG